MQRVCLLNVVVILVLVAVAEAPMQLMVSKHTARLPALSLSAVTNSSPSQPVNKLHCEPLSCLPAEHNFAQPPVLERLNQFADEYEIWVKLPFADNVGLMQFTVQFGDELLPYTSTDLVCAAMRQVVVHTDTDAFIALMDVGEYCVQLDFVDVLRTLVSADIGISVASAHNLSELHARLPPRSTLAKQDQHYFGAALKHLLKRASDGNGDETGVEYGVQVEIALLFVKEVWKEELRGNVHI